MKRGNSGELEAAPRAAAAPRDAFDAATAGSRRNSRAASGRSAARSWAAVATARRSRG